MCHSRDAVGVAWLRELGGLVDRWFDEDGGMRPRREEGARMRGGGFSKPSRFVASSCRHTRHPRGPRPAPASVSQRILHTFLAGFQASLLDPSKRTLVWGGREAKNTQKLASPQNPNSKSARTHEALASLLRQAVHVRRANQSINRSIDSEAQCLTHTLSTIDWRTTGGGACLGRGALLIRCFGWSGDGDDGRSTRSSEPAGRPPAGGGGAAARGGAAAPAAGGGGGRGGVGGPGHAAGT